MTQDIATLRRRPVALLLRRLRFGLLLTFWVPLLMILIERGLPWLALGGYLVIVVAATAAYHGFESLRDRGRTALVPTAIRLDADGLQLDVRNVGQAEAQTCDVMAWVIALPPGRADTTFEESAQRLSLDQRPHFSQRLVAMAPGEELHGHALARVSGPTAARQPGRYHIKWRTTTTDRHGRRTSLEGWVATEVA